ncbi:MAG: geranylgeranylglycerol-phosphate geranylgeranyltransferase [Lentimicrobiaceae bacterium]|nr:geranylgeranylglycerol-phosphate geranylgeranyltransferase [Lentimicrobiaceae bacterium]
MKYTFIRRFCFFLQLIRWPNLVVIILTQFLLGYAVIQLIYSKSGLEPALSNALFWLLVGVTVAIAAAGYIINDYFDLRADRINHPDIMILGRIFRRRLAIKYNLILNAMALAGGVYLGLQTHSWRLSLIFPLMMVLLVLYSSRYKNTVLWGNLAIAFMSAMVVMVVWLFEFFALLNQPDIFVQLSSSLNFINKIFLFYAGFAFLVSLCRELAKDMQDIPGDLKAGYNTLPIKYGIKISRNWLLGFTVLTLGFMIWALMWLFNKGLNIPMAYYLITVVPLLIFVLYRVMRSGKPEEYKSISLVFKIMMVAGVLGLQPFSMALG